MKIITLISLIVISLFMSSLSGNAAIIYNNDFGTAEQFKTFSWSTLSGRGVSDLMMEDTSLTDMDGDELVRQVVQATTFGASCGVKAIYAPTYKKLSDCLLSIWGRGSWSAQNSGAVCKLSNDGITWDYTVKTDNSNKMQRISVSSGTGVAYNNLTRVWVAVEVCSGSGSVPSHHYGRLGNLKLEGTMINGAVGDRLYIYLNDFGTKAQQDAWIVDGAVSYTDDPLSDITNDNLSNYVSGSATRGVKTLTIRIDAPKGYAFRNPIAAGKGYGSLRNWGNSTLIRLSLDGKKWDVSSPVPNAINGWYDMVADSTGIQGYAEKLTAVYLQIYMSTSNTGSFLPRAKQVAVSGELIAVP